MKVTFKSVWLALLASVLLVGCQGNQIITQTNEQAFQASLPSNGELAQKLIGKDPKLTPVYFFVPELLRATDYSTAMNGRTANLRVNLNGKTIAIVPVKKGVKLELLPNQQYLMTFGEDWEKQSDFMLKSIQLNTLEPGTFIAYDVHTDMEHANTAVIKQLNAEQTLENLNSYPLVSAKVPMPQIALGAKGFNQQLDSCLKQNELAPCQQLVDRLPQGYAPNSILKHMSAIKDQQRRKQQLIAMEESLPANVRRDKYMVQLSSYLKQQDFKAALDIFPKLEALPINTDPSLKFFYGESLLKTGQPGKALQKLYEYINEQGTQATHYAQALDLINQAESEL